MVAFYELENSPVEQWGTDGFFEAKRRLMCAWTDRYSLLEYVANTGATYPYRTSTGARAVGATVIPFNDNPAVGSTADQMSYDTAIVTVTYALHPYAPEAINGRMVIETLYPSMEYKLLPKEQLHVGSPSGANPRRDMHVLAGNLDYRLEFHDLIAATDASLAIMGTCNAAAFQTYLLGITFPAQTLAFFGPSPNKVARLGKTQTFKLLYTFKYRYQPWTKDWTENGWQYIYNAAGDLAYPTANFEVLRNVA